MERRLIGKTVDFGSAFTGSSPVAPSILKEAILEAQNILEIEGKVLNFESKIDRVISNIKFVTDNMSNKDNIRFNECLEKLQAKLDFLKHTKITSQYDVHFWKEINENLNESLEILDDLTKMLKRYKKKINSGD